MSEQKTTLRAVEGFATDHGYVRIADMSREQLIECINHLSADLESARAGHRRSIDVHRAFASARNLAHSP